MRVCQPEPLAFQRAMTSGGSLMDNSRRGLASRGRPRRTSLPPRRRSASATHLSVISGASSALAEVRTDLLCFTFMAMSHADNAPGWAPGCPYEYHQPIIEPAHRDEPRLTIVEPIIGPREVRPRENLFGPAQVQAPLRQRLSSLGRVAGDAHLIIVDTFNATVNPDRTRPQMLANDEVERRGCARPNEADLSTSSTPSMVNRSYNPAIARTDC